MAESDFQRTPLTYAVDRLRHHFRNRRDVYVSGNPLLYYEEGNPRAMVAPDVFVVLGVANADRSVSADVHAPLAEREARIEGALSGPYRTPRSSVTDAYRRP